MVKLSNKQMYWVGFFVSLFSLFGGFIVGVVYGWQEGIGMTDALEIAECKAHFDKKLLNITDACVLKLKKTINWTAIMDECKKCDKRMGAEMIKKNDERNELEKPL